MIAALALAAAAAPCPEPGPADAPFRVSPRAARVRVVVEVWPAGAPDGWTDAVLDALDAAGVSAAVVVPASADPAAFLPVLARVREAPHELVVALTEAATPDTPAEARALRSSLAAWSKAGETPRSVVSRVGERAVEASLGRAGFRTLLDAAGDPTATPRPAGHFDGQPPLGMVLPPGPWDGEDLPPRCAPFRPATADRLARTLERAQGLEGTPVVRWALTGRGGDLDDAAVVARWLAEIGLPAGAGFGTPTEIRRAVEAGERVPSAPAPPPGRSVETRQVLEAAEALRDLDLLPRTLPGGLSLTEAFLAFAVRVAGDDGERLQVPVAAGPAQSARSGVTGPTVVDRDALTTWARALLAAVPAELPSAARVGDRVLPAREVLVALASAARGDAEVTTRPVSDPEPAARGLGWGP